jgi:transposase
MASTTRKKDAKNSLVTKRVLHSQAREIVYNVYEHFLQEFQLSNPDKKPILKDIKLKVSKATKVGFRTVERVLAEKQKMEGSGSHLYSTPGKTRPRRIKKCDMDDFDKCALRRIINNFHMTENERPTLATVLKKAREDLNFKGSRESIRLIIRRLGFKWRKCEDN